MTVLKKSWGRARNRRATRLLNRALIQGFEQVFPSLKKFTNKNLSMGGFLPHVVGPQGGCRNKLLFAVVHKLLPWLFTAVRMYSQS